MKEYMDSSLVYAFSWSLDPEHIAWLMVGIQTLGVIHLSATFSVSCKRSVDACEEPYLDCTWVIILLSLSHIQLSSP